jgi:hypothetical protein
MVGRQEWSPQVFCPDGRVLRELAHFCPHNVFSKVLYNYLMNDEAARTTLDSTVLA